MVIISIIVTTTKGKNMNTLRFSRQVNYPDIAYNIQSLIYELQSKGKSGVESLQILDLAYRNWSKTYCDFSDKYLNKFQNELAMQESLLGGAA